MIEEICGTCTHKVYMDGEWLCGCDGSDMFGIETEYADTCEEWEGEDDN